MLVKWAIEARRKSANMKPSQSDTDRHDMLNQPTPVASKSISAKDNSRLPESHVESETTAQALNIELERLHYRNDAAFARTTEDEGERAMRRIHAEERDTKLRDEKLLSLVEPQTIRHHSSQELEPEPCMPLTVENIEKLVHEQDGDSPAYHHPDSPDEGSTNLSSLVNQPQSRSESRARFLLPPRPTLSDMRQNGSDQTVVDRMK